jgi:hypothetical protein
MERKDHDAGGRAKAVVELGIAGEQGLAVPGYLLHDAAGHLKLGIVDGAPVQPPRHAKNQLPVIFAEHDKAPLRSSGTDHLIHNTVQHLVQVQGRAKSLRHTIQERQVALPRGAWCGL